MFMALFYQLIEKTIPQSPFSRLVPAQNACAALDVFDRLRAVKLLESIPTASNNWTYQDGILMFAGLTQDTLATLKAGGRSMRTIRRHMQHWSSY